MLDNLSMVKVIWNLNYKNAPLQKEDFIQKIQPLVL